MLLGLITLISATYIFLMKEMKKRRKKNYILCATVWVSCPVPSSSVGINIRRPPALRAFR